MNEVINNIKNEISENDVVLYMKGTSSMPQCGFSSRVAGVLNYLEVVYKDVNVLENEDLREGIKSFSEWPTIPQLYIKGEFVGGCDIITEMAMSGELDELLEKNKISYSSEAATKIREANKHIVLLHGAIDELIDKNMGQVTSTTLSNPNTFEKIYRTLKNQNFQRNRSMDILSLILAQKKEIPLDPCLLYTSPSPRDS